MSRARAYAPHEPTRPASVDELLRQGLERLLREKRYEDALLMLYRERERAPGDLAIRRDIRQLEEHLTVRYGRELGSLDGLPVLVDADDAIAKATPEQRHVLRLIDGEATFGDVLESSRLGRFETHRLLATLLQRGAIVTRAPSIDFPNAREPAAPAESDPEPSAMAPGVALPPRSAVQPVDEPAAEDRYEELSARATEAYLAQRFEDAIRLYEECLAMRPTDWRVDNNLRRLRARMGEPTS